MGFVICWHSCSLFSFGLSACDVFNLMPNAGVENGNLSNNPVVIVANNGTDSLIDDRNSCLMPSLLTCQNVIGNNAQKIFIIYIIMYNITINIT